MKANLVLLLAGPLQSWGGPAPGIYERPTEPMPTLSGVVGILANALGRSRGDDISDLAAGRLAVRADRPGEPVVDFHTVGAGDRLAPVADGNNSGRRTVCTERHYLADAAFLAVYTPPDGTDACELLHALSNPKRPLYLGRRSCPPAARIGVTVTDATEREVIRNAALLREPPRHAGRSDSRYYYDAQDTAPQTPAVVVHVERSAAQNETAISVGRLDRPATFDPRRLYHLPRQVTRETLRLDAGLCAGRGHDALRSLHESLGVQQ